MPSTSTADNIEERRAAPDEWRDAVAVLKANRIDSDDPGELLEPSDYGD